MRYILLFFLYIVMSFRVQAQSVPATEENIPFLVTFGAQSQTAWGDDDFVQTFFFIIPQSWKKPFFIRVFDPDINNTYDEINGVPDTETTFTVLGGSGAFTHPDATLADPIGNYKSGTKLAEKTFDSNIRYDNKWYNFGPFNPIEGEWVNDFKGYLFKIVAQGIKGDDGNLYKYFLSSDPNENKVVEGANAFTYEYSFRMWDEAGKVSHLYPFINDKVVSVKINIFDFDNDGKVRIVSAAKKSEEVKVSGDNAWSSSIHQISDKEKNASLDIQLIKLNKAMNNNVVFYITNQYGELLPFFTTPIGGVPKYPYNIKHKSFEGGK
jgi:hypothetical protein